MVIANELIWSTEFNKNKILCFIDAFSFRENLVNPITIYLKRNYCNVTQCNINVYFKYSSKVQTLNASYTTAIASEKGRNAGLPVMHCPRSSLWLSA